MSDRAGDTVTTQRVTILLLTLAVSVAFIGMIRGFLVSLFLAAVFSGLAYPVYKKILTR